MASSIVNCEGQMDVDEQRGMTASSQIMHHCANECSEYVRYTRNRGRSLAADTKKYTKKRQTDTQPKRELNNKK